MARPVGETTGVGRAGNAGRRSGRPTAIGTVANARRVRVGRMTKRDYKILAASLFRASERFRYLDDIGQTELKRTSLNQWSEWVGKIADALLIDNDRFARNKFTAACTHR